ncbi:hypothetical protein SEUCBS139899_007983 [Sporothrix eucalyptigena]|uniref:C2H2-type domain-containing protein n=1 Tax=Sporothrix eucalyptigena TaxID=1812306 RepID=A0ABP0D522_9PEZI
MLPQFDSVFDEPFPSRAKDKAATANKMAPKTSSTNLLAFLDKQKNGSNTEKRNDDDETRPVQLAKQHPHTPLLGGAENSYLLPSVEPTGQDTSIVLYGLQGHVQFNTRDPSSFVDAVIRLMGPTRTINVAFLRLDDDDCPLVVDTVIHDIVNDSVADTYGFDKVLYHLARVEERRQENGSDTTIVPFVYTPMDRLPEHYWEPAQDREGVKRACNGFLEYHDSLIYCRSSGKFGVSSNDTAYLLGFLNGRLGWKAPITGKEHREQMMVVARILTPNAGLAILEKGDAGLIAHCRFGLSEKQSEERSIDRPPSFMSLGGMGFSQAQWDYIAKNPSGGTVYFDVEPLKKHSVGIFLAGFNSSSQLDKKVDGSENVGTGLATSVRAGLAKRIDPILRAATTSEEQKLITGITIWPKGLLWDHEEWPVHSSVVPCTVKSLERMEDQPEAAPSVVVMRPVYSSYKAHVVGSAGLSFSFEIDGRLDTFLDQFYDTLQTDEQLAVWFRMHKDGMIHKPAIWIRQHKDGRTGTRPEFFVMSSTTQRKWLEVCSQIVAPEIWVQPYPDELVADGMLTSGWGLQGCYENFRTIEFHNSKYALSVKEREREQSVVGIDGTENFVQGAVEESNEELFKDSNEEEEELVMEYIVEEVDDTNLQSPFHGLSSLEVCTLCAFTFGICASATERLRHMVDAHGSLYGQLRFAQPGVIVEDSHQSHAGETHSEEHQPTTAPARTRPKRKRNTLHESGDTADSSADSGSDPTVKSNRAKPKKRRTKTRTEDDPTYDPRNDGSDDERDHDLGSAKLLVEDLVDEEHLRKRKATAKKRIDDPTYRPSKDDEDDGEDNSQFLAPKRAKRGRSIDPSYRPCKGDDDDDEDKNIREKSPAPKKVRRGGSVDPSYRPPTDEDVEEGEELFPETVNGKPSKKSRRGGFLDPSYRPNGNAADDDEQDESLRLSAVPEYSLDPTDPAGKRIRIIRETRQSSVPRGEPRAKARAASPFKGGSATGTPRPGRSRATTPALE